jgi:hypothetical protein
MFKFKIVTHKLLLAIALLLPLSSLAILSPSPSVAQTQQSASKGKGKFGGFFAPKGTPMPQDSEGWASRGECLRDLPSLEHGMNQIVLLTPEGNAGLSQAARPAFFAHVESKAAQKLYFSLKNADETYFYEDSVTVTQPGVVKIQLPADAPELQVGEDYRLSVAMICHDRLEPDSPWASAWVKRVAASVLAVDSSATVKPTMELASAYGQAGLWYDTVETLFRVQASQSDPNADSALNQLFASQGLPLNHPAPASLAVAPTPAKTPVSPRPDPLADEQSH